MYEVQNELLFIIWLHSIIQKLYEENIIFYSIILIFCDFIIYFWMYVDQFLFSDSPFVCQLSIWLSFCLYYYLSVSLSAYLFICLTFCLFYYMSVYQFICLSIYLFSANQIIFLFLESRIVHMVFFQ